MLRVTQCRSLNKLFDDDAAIVGSCRRLSATGQNLTFGRWRIR
jgi:hypothetical protein